MSDKQPKILITGPLPPTIGGVATYIQSILKSPAADKYELIPLRTMSRKHGTMEYGYEKSYIKILRVIKDLFLLTVAIIRHNPAIIHLNTSFEPGAFHRDILYTGLSKSLRKKVFLQIHGGRLDRFVSQKSGISDKMLHRMLKWPDKIGVLSLLQANPFYKHGFKENVRIIPNSVNLSIYQSLESDRTKLEWPEKAFVILFISSHFVKEKGIYELLRAFHMIYQKQKSARLVLVGDGDQITGMKQFTQTYQLSEVVEFAGFLPQMKIRRMLISSDVLVLPSYAEGFPYVILEAMASGLPVVATPVGAIPEIIEDNVNGYIIPVGDYKMMARKILSLMKNSGIRSRMSETNIQAVKNRYNLPVMANHLCGIYKEIIGL